MTRYRWFVASAIVGGVCALSGDVPRLQQTPHHEFAVVANRDAFEPPRLEVHEHDVRPDGDRR